MFFLGRNRSSPDKGALVEDRSGPSSTMKLRNTTTRRGAGGNNKNVRSRGNNSRSNNNNNNKSTTTKLPSRHPFKQLFGPNLHASAKPSLSSSRKSKPIRGAQPVVSSSTTTRQYQQRQRQLHQQQVQVQPPGRRRGQQQQYHQQGRPLQLPLPDKARGEEYKYNYGGPQQTWDNASVDMSLYTTPSRATVEYWDHTGAGGPGRMDSTITSGSYGGGSGGGAKNYYDMYQQMKQARLAAGLPSKPVESFEDMKNSWQTTASTSFGPIEPSSYFIPRVTTNNLGQAIESEEYDEHQDHHHHHGKPKPGTILSPPPSSLHLDTAAAHNKNKTRSTTSTAQPGSSIRKNRMKKDDEDDNSFLLSTVSTNNVIHRLKKAIPTAGISHWTSSPKATTTTKSEHRDYKNSPSSSASSSSSQQSSPSPDNRRKGKRQTSSWRQSPPPMRMSLPESPPSSPLVATRSFSSYNNSDPPPTQERDEKLCGSRSRSNKNSDKKNDRPVNQQRRRYDASPSASSSKAETAQLRSPSTYQGPVDLDEEIDFSSIILPNEVDQYLKDREDSMLLAPRALAMDNDGLRGLNRDVSPRRKMTPSTSMDLPMLPEEEQTTSGGDLESSLVTPSHCSFQSSTSSWAYSNPTNSPRQETKKALLTPPPSPPPSPPPDTQKTFITPPPSPPSRSESQLEFVESPASSYLIWTDDEDNGQYQRGSVHTGTEDGEEGTNPLDLNDVLSERSELIHDQEDLIWTDDEDNEQLRRGSVRSGTEDEDATNHLDDHEDETFPNPKSSPNKSNTTFALIEDISTIQGSFGGGTGYDNHHLDLQDDYEDDNQSDGSSGVVLLTASELENHLKRTIVEGDDHPPPPCPIKGYEAWKTKREAERKRFAKMKLEQQAKLAQRQEELKLHESYDQSVMERSLTHGLATTPEKESKRRGWSLFLRRTPSPPKKNSRQKPKRDNRKKKKVEKQTIPLRNFLEISSSPQRDEDVGEVSLAPLHAMENLTRIDGTLIDINDATGATRTSMSPFQKTTTKQRANDLLQQERQRQMQAQVEQERRERKEKRRIEVLRERELTRQRLRESQPRRSGPAPPPLHGETKEDDRTPRQNISSTHDRHDDTGLSRHVQGMVNQSINHPHPSRSSPTNSNDDDDSNVLIQDMSGTAPTKPCSSVSSLTSRLTPCVACRSGERTHIAMPCMHFAFCEDCVQQFYEQQGKDGKKSSSVCPVCQTEDVVFTRVHLG